MRVQGICTGCAIFLVQRLYIGRAAAHVQDLFISCAIVVQLTLRGGVRGTGAHPHGAIKVAAASRDFVVKPPSLLTGPRHRRHHYRGEQGHLLPHNPCCATMPLASVFAGSFDPILAVANAFDAIRVPFEPYGSIENANSILSGDNPT